MGPQPLREHSSYLLYRLTVGDILTHKKKHLYMLAELVRPGGCVVTFVCKVVCPVFLPVFFPVIEYDCSMSAGIILLLTAMLGLSCAFRDNVVQLPRSRIRRSPILDHHAQLGLEPMNADVNAFLTTTPTGATLSLNLLREYYLSRSRPELPCLSSLSTPIRRE